jgi:ribosomal protein S6
MSDGHYELMALIQDAHDHDQQGGVGTSTEDRHASEFHSVVVLALRNMAYRIDKLERELEVAEETIDQLEAR